MQEVNFCAQVIPTKSSEQMRRTRLRLVSERSPKVAVVGGDGTVRLKVQEEANLLTALGIIPRGAFNYSAAVLPLPTDLPLAMGMLEDGIVRSIDVGTVGNRYFIGAAWVGFFVNASAPYGPSLSGTNQDIVNIISLIIGTFAIGLAVMVLARRYFDLR